MNKFIFSKKAAGLIIQNRTLRTTFALIISLLVMTLILLWVGGSFSKKVDVNEGQILDAQRQLEQLKQIVSEDQSNATQRTEGREFAPYDQIVPFIGLLESLFAIIDPESEISVKNQESEIYINRFADYEVQLRPAKKMELFIKALNELHKAKYLTKIVTFDMNYTPAEGGGPNVIRDAKLTIRLFFE